MVEEEEEEEEDEGKDQREQSEEASVDKKVFNTLYVTEAVCLPAETGRHEEESGTSLLIGYVCYREEKSRPFLHPPLELI